VNPSEQAAVALADSSVAAKAAEQLLADAIAHGAHTLHLEPHQDRARVRYRIDGVLHEWAHLSEHALGALIAHFKHRAALTPHEKRWSQEGRFLFLSTPEGEYTIQLTTIPLADKEKAVLHIFNTRLQTHNFAQLGIWGDTRKQLNRALTAKQGLIVISGPQHSGVSTSLRSALTTLNRPTRSILTVEDPIEHRLQGVHQLRVDRAKGIDVPHGISIALKSDINTILLSNLQGKRATDAALEAGTKGRMVLAGMHAAGMVQTMQQLIDATSEHYLLAHNLQAVLYQRLIRRLCDNCKLPARPDAAMLRRITMRTNITVATLQHFMEETAKHQGGRMTLQLMSANPLGCDECHHTGFKGRVGMFELFTNSAQAQRRLSGHADPTAVLHNAVKAGMMPMLVDGFVKALCGLTTIEEVLHSYK